MKIAIIEIYPLKKINLPNMIDAHLRNAFILKNHLDKIWECDLIITEDDFLRSFNKKYDMLILAYASRYAPFNSIKKLLELNPEANKIMIQNEYTLGASAVGGFKDYDLISNYPFNEVYTKGSSNVKKNYTLNLNLLFSRVANPIAEKKYDCIYYGTFRPGRKKYAKEYLQDGIYLSTTAKNYKKYIHTGCNPKLITKLNWQFGQETLNNFKYSIYFEDEFTHKIYNHLANRWYECGFCNVVVFFDWNCKTTIQKSEISPYWEEIQWYMVKNLEELKEKIKICNLDFIKHLEIQKGWRKSEQILRKNMLADFNQILENINAGN